MSRPIDFTRRSPIYRVLESAGAQFEARAGAAVAIRYAHEDAIELDTARRMGLADLSPLPRTGFKGRGTPDWLRAQGVALPPAPNLAQRQPGGERVARLSEDEHLVLGELAGEGAMCARLEEAWSVESAPGCFPMPRRDTHFWYALAGAHAAATLAKLCAVDMRPHKFADGRLAQTSLARINVIAIRGDLGATPLFHVLGDSSCARYLWACLLDAMAEFDGGLVGLAALLALAEAPAGSVPR